MILESVGLDKNLIIYFRTRVRKWGRKNYIDYPWRSTSNIWHAVVAEIMLQRTKVDQVLPVYNDFIRRFPDAVSYLKTVEKSGEDIFGKLGLRWRNEILGRTAAHFVKNGIPEDRISLLETPGVGDYVASAILSLHFEKRELLIDSNIIRLYGRFIGFNYDNETRRKRWFRELVDDITPGKNVKEFNYAVLDYAMKMCTLIPDCNRCLVRRKCYYFNKMNAEL